MIRNGNERRGFLIFIVSVLMTTSFILLKNGNNVHLNYYPLRESTNSNNCEITQSFCLSDLYSPFCGDASSGEDSSLAKYIGLEQIFGEISGITPTYQVVIFDHLIDYTHPDLSDAISKIVLLPNDNDDDIIEIPSMNLGGLNPFVEFPEYIEDYDHFGHGTQIAGIIHQIAPMVPIISVAMRVDITSNNLKPTYEKFIEWLEDNRNENLIINISNEWSLSLTADDMNSGISGSIAYRLCDLIYDESFDYYKNLFFVCSAGNTGYQDIVFPANLADDWIHYPWVQEIPNKYDINGDNAKANGITSVGAIYDHYNSEDDIKVGQRKPSYAFDQDADGDLELMAPGFNIETTFPTYNPDPNPGAPINYALFSGTSASAPVVCGLAALLSSAIYPNILSAVELEKVISQMALYDSNVDLWGTDKMQKYGYGMVNYLETFGLFIEDLDDYNNDTDTLPDYEELYLAHSDINLRYTDGDNWDDDDEFKVTFTDPTLTDTDGDNIDDYDEYIYWGGRGFSSSFRTEYCNIADVDNDGLLDGDEINIHDTDPLDDDSDDDGLLDGEEITAGSNPFAIDTDCDGLNDYQEIKIHFTNALLVDTDSDGMEDLYEVINNLNPLTDDSFNDPDNDDLTNIEEYSYGTDPHLSDTDGDGMPDGWEITYSLNPLSDDATGDSDNDGLHNVSEYNNDCDPTDSDSDNDGLNDHQEILNNCDPNDTDSDNDGWNDYFEVYTSGTEPDKADTDSDGLTDKNEYNYWKYTRGRTTSQAYAYCKNDDVDNDNLEDGAELALGCDPLDNDTDNDGLYDGSEDLYYDTDPTDYDSDNDGYSDGEEVAAGSDPNDPNDTPGGGGGFGW